MTLLHRTRRLTAAALLTLLALAPLHSPARAEGDSEPGAEDSAAGAFMAVACGASVRVARQVREPIVYAVTGVICLFAALDAMLTDDRPPS